MMDLRPVSGFPGQIWAILLGFGPLYFDQGHFAWIWAIPGDQPELSKCMMPLLLNYQSKIVGHGLELKRIVERLLI